LMAEAGVDLNVAHMGNTAGGSVGQDGVPVMDDAVRRTQEIADAGRRVNPNILTLCHGGPIAMPEDAAYIFERTDIEGFVGASSMERLPVEKPLEETSRRFKNLSITKRSQ
jgi:predicted TIM-barrel enzyme